LDAPWASEPLEAGTYTVTAQADAELARIVHARPGDGREAHPLWAFVAPRAGSGTTLADLCALAAVDIEDGPLLGSLEIEWQGPVEVGVAYRVTGETLDLERKRGRSGTFDLFTFRERLVGPSGDEVVTLTSTFVLPREPG
jgi:acyl dehydratase